MLNMDRVCEIYSFFFNLSIRRTKLEKINQLLVTTNLNLTTSTLDTEDKQSDSPKDDL